MLHFKAELQNEPNATPEKMRWSMALLGTTGGDELALDTETVELEPPIQRLSMPKGIIRGLWAVDNEESFEKDRSGICLLTTRSVRDDPLDVVGVECSSIPLGKTILYIDVNREWAVEREIKTITTSA